MIPSDYLASRQQFLTLARQIGAVVESHELTQNPQQLSNGADAPRLSTDTALIGKPDAERLIVIASGTHGVEGYAGAACQLRFMEAHARRCSDAQLACLLVHAVNPWGYLMDRRVTREGIDLNRNFIDFDAPLPPSAYHRYHRLLLDAYRPLPAGLFNRLQLLGCLLRPAQRREFQAAVTAGQHTHADGLFYGGRAAAESRRIWERIIDRHTRHASRIVLLDLHTGLGRFGHGELISQLPALSPRFQRMNAWFGGTLTSMADDASVSSVVAGTLTEAFDKSLQARYPGADCIGGAIGLEFGTSAPLSVLNALQADQWCWNRCTAAKAGLGVADQPSVRLQARIRQRMRDAFAPRDPRWERKVLTRFDEVVTRLMTGLAAD